MALGEQRGEDDGARGQQRDREVADAGEASGHRDGVPEDRVVLQRQQTATSCAAHQPSKTSKLDAFRARVAEKVEQGLRITRILRDLNYYLADNVQAWTLGRDGAYTHCQRGEEPAAYGLCNDSTTQFGAVNVNQGPVCVDFGPLGEAGESKGGDVNFSCNSAVTQAGLINVNQGPVCIDF